MPCQRLEDRATLLPAAFITANLYAAKNLANTDTEHYRSLPDLAEEAQAVKKGETEAQESDS